MAILHNNVIPSVGVYKTANSLRCNDDDSAYLSRTPASAGNRKTWTWARWVKRANLGTTQYLSHCYDGASNQRAEIKFQADDTLRVYTGGNTAGNGNVYTTAKFRDVGAFYHIMVRMDTTLATAADRIRIYVNGVLQAITIDDQCTQNFEGLFNTTNAHHIAGQASSATFDGYLADDIWVDGQSLDPSNFGETGTYGEFKPIQYTGTYGTNGHNLDFEASGDLGNDVSGNGNDWTPTNLAATDQMLDTPTNNFAVLNILDRLTTGANGAVFAEGNLNNTSASGNFSYVYSPSSIGVDSGKWYAEIHIDDQNATTSSFVGVRGMGGVSFTTSTFPVGTIVGIAIDADNDSATVYKNNVSHTTLSGSAGTTYYVEAGPITSGSNETCSQTANFGQDSSFAGNKTAQGNTDANGKGDFYYSPPSGYLALCTSNLDEPTVVPSEHFSTKLFTGTDSTPQSITGIGFSPDLAWFKRRNLAASHVLIDRVRGTNKVLGSNTTNAEQADSGDGFSSFDADGYTIVAHLTAAGQINKGSMVSWNWKANGAGVSNTDGSITSTVSANADAGFSIVSYTATGTAGTVGHGLSKALEMIIVKHRDQALTGWPVYHKDNTAAPETDYLRLHGTNATSDDANAWNDTAPTSSVFSIGNNGGDTNNTSGGNTIAYCFHSVDGFSKFGSYTGNGSTDGPFVYCGFRPAYVMIKKTSGTGSWYVLDSARDPDNSAAKQLYPDVSNAEGGSGDFVDILSNGFKLKTTATDINTNGASMIFVAFAEMPFANTNAR